MGEVEVTEEMVAAGLEAASTGGVLEDGTYLAVMSFNQAGDPGHWLVKAYRAMRALEPLPQEIATDQSGHPMPSVKFWR